MGGRVKSHSLSVVRKLPRVRLKNFEKFRAAIENQTGFPLPIASSIDAKLWPVDLQNRHSLPLASAQTAPMVRLGTLRHFTTQVSATSLGGRMPRYIGLGGRWESDRGVSAGHTDREGGITLITPRRGLPVLRSNQAGCGRLPVSLATSHCRAMQRRQRTVNVTLRSPRSTAP